MSTDIEQIRALLQSQLNFAFTLPTLPGGAQDMRGIALTVDPVDFYQPVFEHPDAKIKVARLWLPPGITLVSGDGKTPDEKLTAPRKHGFLIEPHRSNDLSEATLHPLSQSRSLIRRANRRLKLQLNEQTAPAYVKFYAEFGKLYHPDRRLLDGRFGASEHRFHVLDTLGDLQFSGSPGANQERAKAHGALWHLCAPDPAGGAYARSERLTCYFKTAIEFFHTPLYGWVPSQLQQSLVEVKVRIGRFSGDVTPLRAVVHFASPELQPPELDTTADWPKPVETIATRLAKLRRQSRRHLATIATGVAATLALTCVAITLLTPLIGSVSHAVLPSWKTLLGLGNPAAGSLVLGCAAVATLVGFTLYNLVWIDLNSLASWCRDYEHVERNWLVQRVIWVAEWHAARLHRIGGFRSRLWGAAKRAVTWIGILVLAFTSLQLAIDADPFTDWAKKPKSQTIEFASWVNPANYPTAFSTASILFEDTIMHLPGILSFRSMRPMPAGSESLSWFLRIGFTLISAFVVFRGVRRFWEATSGDRFALAVASGFASSNNPLKPRQK